VAATWVSHHLADRIELRTNSVGDLAFFRGVPATVKGVPATVQEGG